MENQNKRNSQIPVIGLQKFTYIKERRRLVISSRHFGVPDEFKVISHRTGKVINFKTDRPVTITDDAWDDNVKVYYPVEHCEGVNYCMIYRA